MATERIQSWMMTSEQDKIQNQADVYLNKAYNNLSIAIENKLVPSKYLNNKDLSSILNVIFSGVNNTDDEEIYKIGMKIYDRFKSIIIDRPKGLDFMQNQAPIIQSQPDLNNSNRNGNKE